MLFFSQGADLGDSHSRVQTEVFLFQMHHCISDGSSMSIAMQEFTDILNDVILNRETTHTNMFTQIEQPLEHYLEQMRDKLSATQRIFILLHKVLPLFVQKSLVQFLVCKVFAKQVLSDKREIFAVFQQDIPDDVQLKTSIVPVQLTKEETKAILLACKAKKVTGKLYASHILNILACKRKT